MINEARKYQAFYTKSTPIVEYMVDKLLLNQSDKIFVPCGGDGVFVEAILDANESMKPEDVGSALFTVTDDLASTFPAQAARQMGWGLVPMMCAREIPVPGSLRKVIRVLVHWNTAMPQSEIIHVYLKDAVKLRPDLIAAQ